MHHQCHMIMHIGLQLKHMVVIKDPHRPYSWTYSTLDNERGNPSLRESFRHMTHDHAHKYLEGKKFIVTYNFVWIHILLAHLLLEDAIMNNAEVTCLLAIFS